MTTPAILESLGALAEMLGHDAQLVAETSGERGAEYEAYEEAWARQHSIVWLAAYFTVPDARRPRPVGEVLEAARERYLAGARSRAGYRRYVAQLPAAARASITRRAALWRVFDGEREVPVKKRRPADVRALLDAALREAPAAAVRDAEPRDAALDAAIGEDPRDPGRYAVYGDWLAERGDPRGELIALSIAHDAARRKAAKSTLATKIAALRERERERFSGGALAAHARNHDRFGGDPFTWKNGFIESACIRCAEPDPARPADVVRDILDHPSGRFLVELHVNHERSLPMIDVQPVIDLIAARGKTLRDLRMADSNLWERHVHVGSFARAWPGLAGLRALRLAGDFVFGDLALPHVETVSLANAVWTRAHAGSIAAARWPALRDFTIDLHELSAGVVGAMIHALTRLPPSVRRIVVTRASPELRAAIAQALAARALDELAFP